MLHQSIIPGPWLTLSLFRIMIRFYGEELLAPRPSPKMEDRPLSAVRDWLFHMFAATLHIGGRSSIRNLKTRHAVVTGTRWSRWSVYTETNRVTEVTSFQILQTTSFWALTIRGDIGSYCLCGGTCYLHLQSPSVFWIKKTQVLLCVTQCRWASISRRFEGSYCVHLQGQAVHSLLRPPDPEG